MEYFKYNQENYLNYSNELLVESTQHIEKLKDFKLLLIELLSFNKLDSENVHFSN